MPSADDRDRAAGSNPLGDAAQGVEHLQAAAKELIRAARSLLDAAEGLVEDPTVVQGLAGTFTDLAGAAASWLRTSASPSSDADDENPGGGGKVQRINLS
jgi:hypothetical protein